MKLHKESKEWKSKRTEGCVPWRYSEFKDCVEKT